MRLMVGKNAGGGEPRRKTRQKTAILERLKRTEGEHVTADALVEILRRSGTPVGKATVYRYLSELEANGRVRRYRSLNGPSCWQYMAEGAPCDEHYHLLCEGCGNIVHFDSEQLGEAFRSVSGRNGFVLDQAKTVFYGICAACLSEDFQKRSGE